GTPCPYDTLQTRRLKFYTTRRRQGGKMNELLILTISLASALAAVILIPKRTATKGHPLYALTTDVQLHRCGVLCLYQLKGSVLKT
ncbi:hypothetical protein VU10_03330, partial [Desulfobulbus sp. US1]|nr:hypothetical protein [Desulfobulbus sp. US1]